jgi:hypothetical protein
VVNDNRVVARFLFDAMLFNFFPYWTPGAVSAFSVFTFFFFVEFYGIIYGGMEIFFSQII